MKIDKLIKYGCMGIDEINLTFVSLFLCIAIRTMVIRTISRKTIGTTFRLMAVTFGLVTVTFRTTATNGTTFRLMAVTFGLVTVTFRTTATNGTTFRLMAVTFRTMT